MKALVFFSLIKASLFLDTLFHFHPLSRNSSLRKSRRDLWLVECSRFRGSSGWNKTRRVCCWDFRSPITASTSHSMRIPMFLAWTCSKLRDRPMRLYCNRRRHRCAISKLSRLLWDIQRDFRKYSRRRCWSMRIHHTNWNRSGPCPCPIFDSNSLPKSMRLDRRLRPVYNFAMRLPGYWERRQCGFYKLPQLRRIG